MLLYHVLYGRSVIGADVKTASGRAMARQLHASISKEGEDEDGVEERQGRPAAIDH
jgi:hypothetical protein